LILVTASDRDMALPVANHVGLFDEVLGSDGKTNLRGANKPEGARRQIRRTRF